MAKSNNNPTKPILLLVEGIDEERVLAKYIADNYENVEILPYHGDMTKLAALLPALLASDTGILKAIGIICDAEQSKIQRENELIEIINLNKNEDKRLPISYFINPVNEPQGCLENVILAAIIDQKLLECAKNYLSCIYSDDEIKEMNHNLKAKRLVYAIISMSEDPRMSLGSTFENNLFDLQSNSFKPLLKFISDLQEQPS